MARSVFWADDLAAASVGGEVHLRGGEARHAAVVCRTAPGEVLDVVDGSGRRVTGSVVAASADVVDIAVMAVLDEPESAVHVTVVQALIKGERAERAVETLTEVGVDAIVPWSAERCIVTWDARRAERGRARWVATAHESAKQSRRARVPRVHDLTSRDGVVALVESADLAVVLDADAPLALASIDVPASGRVVLVVGPEGGLTDGETSRLVAAGAKPARLGPTVLRASTAGTVAAAVVLARTRSWSEPMGGSTA